MAISLSKDRNQDWTMADRQDRHAQMRLTPAEALQTGTRDAPETQATKLGAEAEENPPGTVRNERGGVYVLCTQYTSPASNIKGKRACCLTVYYRRCIL